MRMWSVDDMPDQSGRAALVTGATDGIGYWTAAGLARAGMRVRLAGRNPAKGEAALARIRSEHPGADVSFEPVEQADLASVRALAHRMAAGPGLDLLVNNAGIMGIPERRTTAQGFEMQLGVNYLSHFALTNWLLPTLRKSSAPRVVSVASLAHRRARIDFDDLQGERRYSRFGAYAQSKLAMLMFAKELQRRSDAAGWGLTSVAAHPGFARTHIFASGPRMGRDSDRPAPMERLIPLIAPIFMQSAEAGASPLLYAATAPDVRQGGYYGPAGLGELKGPPAPAKVSRRAADAEAGKRLWDASAALIGDAVGGDAR